jgi:dolichol-phosphate mannosyltransferase
MAKTLYIVIPCYNEELVIDETIKRITEKLDKLIKNNMISKKSKMLFVNDGSKDNTWNEIEKAASANKNIVGVNFSRNFGKESAMFAGLATATGDCCAVMDCDLQHPPEVLVDMYRLWEQGYEVVEAVKRSRGKESVFHRASAGLFYKMISSAVKIDMSRASDFKLMDRKCVETLLSMPEKNAFFRALSSWIGYKTTSVEFDVQEREAGESKWSTWSLIEYAITNIVAFSSVPMQLVTIAGVLSFIFGIIMGIQTLVRFLMGQSVEGFTTVILLLLMIGSMIMISLGIIGYYISKIYEEVKGRPRYIISKVIGK